MSIKIIKIVGLYIFIGTATSAGVTLWNKVIQPKIGFAIAKFKNKQSNLKRMGR